MVDAQLKTLVPRAIVFVSLFLLLSGVIGSWIVSTNLLSDAGFWIYGNVGKLVLLLLVFLGLQLRKKFRSLEVYPLKKKDWALVVAAPIIALVFFSIAHDLINQPYLDLLVVAVCHMLILLSGTTLFIGSFGTKTVSAFLKTFRAEVKACVLLFPILYLGIFEIWKLWPFFSGGVLKAVTFLLSLTFKTQIVPPYTIYVNGFGIAIAEACSGLDSLFMFSILYLLVIASDWAKINKVRAVVAYLALAVGLYLVNILRVYVMVVIGAVWSPEIAVHVFHTYAGMVLFFMYFLGFMKWGYGWLKKEM